MRLVVDFAIEIVTHGEFPDHSKIAKKGNSQGLPFKLLRNDFCIKETVLGCPSTILKCKPYYSITQREDHRNDDNRTI